MVTLNLYKSWVAFRVTQQSKTFPGLQVFHHKASNNFRVNEWQLKLSVDSFSEVKLNVESKYLVC